MTDRTTEELRKTSGSILDEAASLVNGDRQAAYGHPRDNHRRTAERWTNYLRERGLLANGATVDAYDVCVMNIEQKLSRLTHSRTRDGLTDICGYAANADMVDDAA